MGLLSKVSELGRRLRGARAVVEPESAPRLRICRVEELEPRQLFAADIQIGAVYYELGSAGSGTDSVGNEFIITWQGGAPGTQLSELTIDTDKAGDGLSIDDPFFDILAGGAGAPGFGSLPFILGKHDGFDVTGVSVVDGGTKLKLTFNGFEAGERLFFRIDVDENGLPVPNAVVEGKEFEGSHLVGTFTSPDYYAATGSDVFLDNYDFKLAPSGLPLPPDNYLPPPAERYQPVPPSTYVPPVPPGDQSVYTDGAIFALRQTPLPNSIAGMIHVDTNGDCLYQPGEPLLSGVTVQLFDAANHLVATTQTDANGEYKFDNLGPGTYRVHEVQPNAYLQGGNEVGTVRGVTVGTTNGSDDLQGIVLVANDHGLEYNFCEVLPSSISGMVHVDTNDDCDYQPGEPLLAGVTIQLLDAANHLIATTQTDANGQYKFTGLVAGTYHVREIQPAGYLQGMSDVGSVGGTSVDPDNLAGIPLPAGVDALHYDFCERLPNTIRGRVHVDTNGDCDYQPGEPLLAGVTIQLLNSNGQVVGTTQTDGNGEYQFTNLPAGTYSVREGLTPPYLEGGAAAGSVGGTVVGSNLITGVTLVSGTNATHYDFCEMLPNSISGKVMVSTTGDCDIDPNALPLAGVKIELLDAQGTVVATTTTDAAGVYSFANLVAGTYSVREHTPDGYVDGDEHIGSLGGTLAGNDLVSDIVVMSGDHGTGYDFCEAPPPMLCGYVYQDGPVISLIAGLPPALRQQQLDAAIATHDGLRTPDDTPLEGVTVRLADENGVLLRDSNGNFIEALTDATGMYCFTVMPGRYTVYEVQPNGYLDFLDFAGTTGGAADNPGDTIRMIPVNLGDHSHENNFSELRVVEVPFFLPPPPDAPPGPGPAPNSLVRPPEAPAPLAPVAPIRPPVDFYANGSLIRYTWHLSVINAGRPRANSTFVQVGSKLEVRSDWDVESLRHSSWTLETDTTRPDGQRFLVFGMCHGIPVTGDFNGDGITDVGVYHQGQWFIDLNGNGVWDESDLWARLGSRDDRPVVADWDGDGKTDIGIFGRAWPGDPRAVAAEPGLPDPNNERHVARKKNVPPPSDVATQGVRTMQLTSKGNPRADLIDHVFSYGVPGDRPVAGDWNGTGVDTIGVFRDGRWDLDMDGDGRHGPNDLTIYMGQAGDQPVVGDFNGDGVDELGIFRDGEWHIDTDGNRILDEHDLRRHLGGPGDVPVVGDFNGDGRDEMGVYHDCRVEPADVDAIPEK